MKLKIALLQLLPGRSLEEQLNIGRTCTLEAPEEEGIYLAEIDMDMLRDYREHEVMGEKFRHPDKYRIITNDGTSFR